jgi:hypothetical protein
MEEIAGVWLRFDYRAQRGGEDRSRKSVNYMCILRVLAVYHESRTGVFE